MQKIDVGKFDITFYRTQNYDKNSVDNLPYDDVIIVENETFSKTLAAEIYDGVDIKKVAFVVPYFTPSEFAVSAGENVFLMFDDILCIFDPQGVKIVEEKRINPTGTMFGAYAYKDDFILYGEMEIYRVDRNLEVKWIFSARDIFVRHEGDEPAFEMKEDRICLYDFIDHYYEIDYDGKLLAEDKACKLGESD